MAIVNTNCFTCAHLVKATNASYWRVILTAPQIPEVNLLQPVVVQHIHGRPGEARIPHHQGPAAVGIPSHGVVTGQLHTACLSHVLPFLKLLHTQIIHVNLLYHVHIPTHPTVHGCPDHTLLLLLSLLTTFYLQKSTPYPVSSGVSMMHLSR